jgi:hypothetical protein
MSEMPEIPLKEYVDQQVETAHRVAENALAFAGAPVKLREYIEAILDEHQKAMELAADEREKAAVALREQLSERIAAGDANLREHIMQQVAQLSQLIANIEQVSAQREEGLRREIAIQHAADQTAIAKAEAFNERRFEAANEWRGQSADRERSQQEQIQSFVTTLTPLSKTEAVEEKLTAVLQRDRADIEALTKRMDLQQGQAAGVRVTTSVAVTLITVGLAVLGTIIVLANYFTGS